MKSIFKKIIAMILIVSITTIFTISISAADPIVGKTPNGTEITYSQALIEQQKVDNALKNAYKETNKINRNDGQELTDSDITNYISNNNTMSDFKKDSLKKAMGELSDSTMSLTATSYFFTYDQYGVAISLNQDEYNNVVKQNSNTENVSGKISPLTQSTTYDEWIVYASSTTGSVNQCTNLRDYYFSGWVDFHFNPITSFFYNPDYIGLAWSSNTPTVQSTESCYSSFYVSGTYHYINGSRNNVGQDGCAVNYEVTANYALLLPSSYYLGLTARQYDSGNQTYCAMTNTYTYTWISGSFSFTLNGLSWSGSYGSTPYTATDNYTSY